MDLLWLSLAALGSSEDDSAALRSRMRSRARVRAARRRHRSQTEERLDDLEDEVGELRLFSRALLALLQETGALDPQRLRAKILEIDAEDGTVDGRYDPDPEPESDAESDAEDSESPAAPTPRRHRSR